MSQLRAGYTVERLNHDAGPCLPGHLGVELLRLEQGQAVGCLRIRPEHLAPNGRLHAASLIALADTMTGHATMAHLPEGARSFATIELKSNHFSTLTEGVITCVASAQHLGRTTQVWDAQVTDEASGKTLMLYRCTQMIL